MFGAHMPELVIILVVALVIFGPKRLPEIGSGLGKGIRDFKRSVSEIGHHTDVDQHLSAEPVTVEPIQPHVS